MFCHSLILSLTHLPVCHSYPNAHVRVDVVSDSVFAFNCLFPVINAATFHFRLFELGQPWWRRCFGLIIQRSKVKVVLHSPSENHRYILFFRKCTSQMLILADTRHRGAVVNCKPACLLHNTCDQRHRSSKTVICLIWIAWSKKKLIWLNRHVCIRFCTGD